MTTALTAVHPYLRWSDRATSVWTMVGGGRGAAANERASTGGEEASGAAGDWRAGGCAGGWAVHPG